MPTYSELTITFTSNWQVNDELFIKTNSDFWRWDWVNTRNRDFTVTKGTNNSNVGERAAIAFKEAFDLDFTSGYNTFIQNTNEVVIQTESESEKFENVYSGSDDQVGSMTFSISNFSNENDPDFYKEKYYISYCDDFGTNRRVSILQRGYEGATNIIEDSDNISGAAWTNTQLEISGTRIVATNTNSPHWITQTVSKPSVASNYSAKVSVKVAEYSKVYLRISDTSGGAVIVYFNINTQTFYNLQELNGWVSVDLKNEDKGGGWYEITLEATSSDDDEITLAVGIVNDDDDYVFIGDNLNGVNLSGLDILNPRITQGNDATELTADVNPISINYESSEDFKFSPIRPSMAEVFMIFGDGSGVDFEEFWTIDEKEFKVLDIKDGNIEWSGYVIPDGFQYEFKGGVYYASIQASDGLSLLENLIFVDDNQKPYGNQNLVYNNGFEFPPSLIITEILKKLKLDLDLWTCVDSYERSMTKTGDTRDADPLSACYVNVKTYIKEGENEKIPYWYGSGEEWNCKDVLENILYMFGAKIYQENNTWRVKSINTDADYGSGSTQRYWRKYNSAGAYIFNYEIVNDEINIPCNSLSKVMIGNDHVMSMDEVYNAFRMNYEYTFLRDGDSPIDLLTNSYFCDFQNNSILAAPTGWKRIRRENNDYIRIKDITIDFDDAGGNTCGIEIGTQKVGIPKIQGSIRTTPNSSIYTSLTNDANRPNRRNTTFDVSNSDSKTIVGRDYKLSLSFWVRYPSKIQTSSIVPIFRLILFGANNDYYLRNNKDNMTWERVNNRLSDNLNEAYFFYPERRYFIENGLSGDPTPDTSWKKYSFDIANVPEDGILQFHIHGLAATGLVTGGTPFKTWNITSSRGETNSNYELNDKYRPIVTPNYLDNGGSVSRMRLAGLQLGYIPDEQNLPNQQDYVYYNDNPEYSFRVDPITIYNGDLQDEKHISNIIVPTNTTNEKNFWDDLSGSFGNSSLGLLTVREIMRQYFRPNRILEGTIKLQDARFGSVYTFDVIPDVRFVLLRGTMNKQRQYIEDATFVQISSEQLPNGGYEGGNTLEPDWQTTGRTYCQVDNNALNNGYVVIEEIDVNPNSETYKETREIISETQDLTQCPLLTPRKYYWASDGVNLNLNTLEFAPFTQVSNKEIQISYNNDDGNYLYFVSLKTLGSIERIYTPTSPNNVLSDWVQLEDVIIDGYIYRVLRTDYVMSEFRNFTHNFKFA